MLKKQFSSKFSPFLNTVPEIIVVEIPKEYIENFYDFILKEKQKKITVFGFEKGKVLISYLKDHYKNVFEKIISETFFSIYAHKKIIDLLKTKKYFIEINHIKPKISIDLNSLSLKYIYEVPHVNVLKEQTLNKKKIKLPERKKYKDLDRQAETILAQETQNYKKIKDFSIGINDWIKINIRIVDPEKHTEIVSNLSSDLWLRISNESIDHEIRKLFLEKNIGDTIIAESKLFQDFICKFAFTPYTFLIKITEHVSNKYFSFKNFSLYFNCSPKKHLLETKKDDELSEIITDKIELENIYSKLIDIFSFRKDISLYKETCQIFFNKLINDYKIVLEKKIIENHKNEISYNIKFNPDYLIYISDEKFLNYIDKLTANQIKESILIDHLTFLNEISSNKNDIHWYLNTLQRVRLKDFLYFDISYLKYQNKETPILHEIIEHMVSREKTLQKSVYKLKESL